MSLITIIDSAGIKHTGRLVEDITPVQEQEGWNEKRMDIVGQNGNEGIHYGTDSIGGLFSFIYTQGYEIKSAYIPPIYMTNGEVL